MVVLGLGSNLGDRLRNLREAVARISKMEAASVLAHSRVYETAPVGGPEQGRFLNAALRITTTLGPLDLLDATLAVEKSMGRVRDARWGPRIIDIDILWIDDVVVDTERLVVPHPHLHERAFAVRPLLDVAPSARSPRTNTRYADLLLSDDGISVTDLDLALAGA